MQAPPDLYREGFAGFRELLGLALKFRGVRGREIPDLVAFTTGSLGEFLDRSLASPHLKSLILANSLYGKHGGPYDAGTLFGLLFHLLGGGAESKQGFVGHVMGGMGAITAAMAEACRGAGVELRTSAEVASVRIEGGRATGVVLADGSEIDAALVVSNADPKRTYLRLVPEAALDPEFRAAVAGDQDGRALRQVQPRAVRGAAARERGAGLGRAAARAVHVRALARGRAGRLRRGAPRPHRGGALDRLPRALADRRLARDARPPRDDLLHPVPAVRALGLGLEPRARSPRGAAASARSRASCRPSAARWSRSGSTRRPTSRAPSASPRATSSTATCGPTSSSSCGRCRAMRATPRRCRRSTSAAPAPTRAAA